MNIYNIFLPLSEHFYLFIVCVKCYCCARSPPVKTHSEGLPWTRNRPVEEASTSQHTIITRYTHLCPRGIRACDPSKQAVTDPPLRPRGQWDPQFKTSGTWTAPTPSDKQHCDTAAVSCPRTNMKRNNLPCIHQIWWQKRPSIPPEYAIDRTSM